MDPRHRADEALSRARARGAFVVTPENATSPMDAASTVRIPREVVSGLGGQDPNSTVALRRDQGQWEQGQWEHGRWEQGQRDQRYQAQREPGRGQQQAPPQQQAPQQTPPQQYAQQYGQQPAPQQYGAEQPARQQTAAQQTAAQQTGAQQANSQQTVWPTEEPTNTQYYYPTGHEPTRPFQR